MRSFKRNILQLSEEEDIEILEYCVEFTGVNDDNIKMTLEGSFNFTEGLAGRTISFVDGAITSYRINGIDTACNIELTHNTNTVFFEDNDLPTVTDRVAVSITYTIDLILNTAEEYTINGSKFAIVTPGVQMTSSYNDCE